MSKKIDSENDSPLKKFIQIQDMQFKLDKLKKEKAKISSEVLSLSQVIPKLIRELKIQ